MKVISQRNMPPMFPISGTAVLWLLLDRLRPPGWVVGCAWTVWGLVWIAVIVAAWKSEPVDLFKGKP